MQNYGLAICYSVFAETGVVRVHAAAVCAKFYSSSLTYTCGGTAIIRLRTAAVHSIIMYLLLLLLLLLLILLLIFC
jgi:hypothetical protein